ncbi:MAG TPA: lipopolysaccharide biosynthesis protein [Candidatus Blautia gallistercoris]|uniref:Lipopolysaccharide biosynthesis protein n=1 Tax=Candidatus Blautia gallistercoris TaxID=2838490 RepID=A0A9D1WJS4_9FIRM|nr:lipopolysaccharide biosynthesis protein [Candidatus Blautia gallistercoris]
MWRVKEQATDRQKFLWNMAGSMCNALSSMVLLTFVTRAAGSAKGGIFSLAFSTAQLLSTIGCFETRVIQATDVRQKYKFPVYLTFRLLTCLAMMAGAVGYVWFEGFQGEKAFVILLICFYKAVDSVSDSFQGLFQQRLRIDLSGRALATRVVFCTIVFGIVIFLTRNLTLASLLMVAACIFWFWFHDVRICPCFEKPGLAWDLPAMKGLFAECLPLCIGSFMINYVVNAPKYAIDAYWGDEIQNYYGFLVMPAFVINLFSLFVFRPLLTTLAINWNERKFKGFRSIVGKCVLWVLILTAGAVAGAYLLGIWFLNLFSGLHLDAYRMDLVLIMVGGGMNALIMLFYNVLAVMRRQYLVMGGYTVGFLCSLVISPVLVKRLEIRGAAAAYVIPMAVIVLVFLGITLFTYEKEKRVVSEKSDTRIRGTDRETDKD